MIKIHPIIVALGILLLFSLIYISPSLPTSFKSQLASVFFTDSIDAQDLKTKYKHNDKIKILIVPGHDPEKYGTSFGELTEFELNLELATYLYEKLKENRHFKVGLAQTSDGYQPQIEDYINKNTNTIWSSVSIKKNIMANLISRGLLKENVIVNHNFASNDTALKLHGINHYANQNNIDIIIHVHFNDYPGRRKDLNPKYTGFSIYLPEQQYSNSKASWEIAPYIARNLVKTFPPSTHPKENTVLIADQELIAIGSSNTLDAVAILIEYGYIYESHIGLVTKEDRTKTLEEMANLTTRGLEDFFRD